MTDKQYNKIILDIAELLSILKARHTLLGIAVLLFIQHSCISDRNEVIIKKALTNVSVCTQTGN